LANVCYIAVGQFGFSHARLGQVRTGGNRLGQVGRSG